MDNCFDYKGMYRGKTIMITGGLGFIGSNLAHQLVKLGTDRVIIIDSMREGSGFNIFNIEEIKDLVEVPCLKEGGVDIGDSFKIKKLLDGVDYVFNLAGNTSHVGSKDDPLRDLEINLQSQVSFLNTCKNYVEDSGKTLKIVFTSTRDVYGKVREKDLPIKESSLIREPADPQGINNQAAESYHLWYRNFGIKSSILRLTNTYGPRHQMKTPDGFLNWFIKKSLDGEEIELWGGGESLRDFNYVADVVEALLMVMAQKTDGEIYNLGSYLCKVGKYGDSCNNLKTVSEIAQLVVELSQKGSVKVVPYPEDKKSIEPGNFFANITKIYNDVGWRPSTELKEGIKKTIKFYKENRRDYWG